MATNYLYPFADAAGANVVSDALWQSYAQRPTGFQSGIAKSEYCNRLFAQGGNAGFAIGELIKDYAGKDATIDSATLYSRFVEALTAFGNQVIKPLILDAAYPVGAIYMSMNSTNPHNLFGGTWAALSAGIVLVAQGAGYPAGSTGGAASRSLTFSGTVGNTALTVNQLPAHSHIASSSSAGAHNHTAQSAGSHTHTESQAGSHTHTAQSAGGHTHTRGSMEITGTIAGAGEGAGYCSGAFTTPGRTGAIVNNSGDRDNLYQFTASKTWTGATSSNGSHTHVIDANGIHGHVIASAGAHTHSTDSKGAHVHTITVSNSGGGQTHTHTFTGGSATLSMLPPYMAVYMWRRTA